MSDAENPEKVELDSAEAFEQLIARRPDRKAQYTLRLYVTGMTPRSIEAIENIKTICEQYLKNRYELEVIDIYKHPQLASRQQIVATPTLIKELPLPLRRMVGDLSNEGQVLIGLDIRKG